MLKPEEQCPPTAQLVAVAPGGSVELGVADELVADCNVVEDERPEGVATDLDEVAEDEAVDTLVFEVELTTSFKSPGAGAWKVSSVVLVQSSPPVVSQQAQRLVVLL